MYQISGSIHVFICPMVIKYKKILPHRAIHLMMITLLPLPDDVYFNQIVPHCRMSNAGQIFDHTQQKTCDSVSTKHY
jgi:hypothetical protein